MPDLLRSGQEVLDPDHAGFAAPEPMGIGPQLSE
jgi:hypothetical protein